MAADKELLKEVALELWNTTKKLRPGLPKAPRAQLVLKALLTIGDMSDQLEAAMVLGVIEARNPTMSPGRVKRPAKTRRCLKPMPRPSGRPPGLCASAPAAADQDLQMTRTRSPFPLHRVLDGLLPKRTRRSLSNFSSPAPQPKP